MNITPYIKKLTESWSTKIICLVLALFLYVFYQIASLDRRTFAVPLVVQADGLIIPAESYKSKVRVTFRGMRADTSQISENDFYVYIDLNSITEEGRQTIPLKIHFNDELVKIDPLEVHLYPEQVVLTLGIRMSAEIPIAPTVHGNMANGFTYNATVNPSALQVYGPRSIVESLTQLETESISLDGKTTAFSTSTRIVKPNPFIIFTDGDVATVFVSFTEERIEKVLRRVPIQAYNLPETLTFDAEKLLLDLTISGSKTILEGSVSLEVLASIDCSKITEAGNHTLPIEITLPSNVELRTKTPEEITVTIVANNSVASNRRAQ